MTKTTYETPADLLGAVGDSYGPTDWIEITQERINTFADATDDHQWIHVDVERAAAGPFGGTIAHGYLTLSLCARFLSGLCAVKQATMGINYGVNKARFPAPVRSGARVRARGELAEATEVAGGVQIVVRVTVELEGSEKPAAVVETVSRYLS
jgi:acyl dehydratase